MSRVKTFDSTGLATSGRIYAGDLNAIQDQYADLVNLAQTHSVGSLVVGEAGLQVLRYGPGEARISGHVRLDGILRALGGMYAGAFTTAQRDALAAGVGLTPTGLVILNTTTGRLEINNGTDASRNWGKVGALEAAQVSASNLDTTVPVIPIGGLLDWPYASGSIPSWAALCYGQPISRATYAALHTLASSSAYPHGSGDGSTTFNLPDFRGRVGAGKDNMGGVTPTWVDGAAIGRITAAISGTAGTVLGAAIGAEGIQLTLAAIPAHNHTGNTGAVGTHSHGGSTGGAAPGTDAQGYHSHGGATGAADRSLGHSHSTTEYAAVGYWLRGGGDTGTQYFRDNVLVRPASGGTAFGATNTGGEGAPDHLHGIGGDGSHSHNVNSHGHSISADGGHSHTISTDGGDGTHRNLPPLLIVNKMIRVL